MNYLPIILFAVTVITLFTISLIARIRRDRDRNFALSRTPKSAMTQALIQLAMRIVVSLALLGCSLFVVMSQSYGAQEKHWAFGSLGTILGYWLKSK